MTILDGEKNVADNYQILQIDINIQRYLLAATDYEISVNIAMFISLHAGCQLLNTAVLHLD